MYNESAYVKFELYTIHIGSINSFGGSKVPIYWQRFFYLADAFLFYFEFFIFTKLFFAFN